MCVEKVNYIERVYVDINKEISICNDDCRRGHIYKGEEII